MPLRNTPEAYGFVSRSLHWFLSIGVTIMLCVGVLLHYLSRGTGLRDFFMMLHKSTGLVILVVMVLFCFWRLISKRPSDPEGMPKWQRKFANFVHTLLYITVLAMPFSGWIMSTAAGHPPVFYWTKILPAPFIPVNETLAGLASDVHLILAWSIGVLLALHLLGSLYHHYIRRDIILKRMFSSH